MLPKYFQESIRSQRERRSMLEIDGSQGEGGGQLLRSALAFSALTGQPFHMRKVRAGRHKPGLRPQHLAAVRLAAQLCSARVEGDEVNSGSIRFEPGPLLPGCFRQDVGTAGSLVLLTQASLLPALKAGGEVVLELFGGTDVPMAPSLDYLLEVVLPYYRSLGDIQARVLRRGFAPAGGGGLRLTVNGASSSTPGPLSLCGASDWNRRDGRVVVSQDLENANVAHRISLAARAAGEDEAACEYVESDSTGAVLTLWAWDGERRWSGASALGRRGWPSEKLGAFLAEKQRSQLCDPRPVDEHLADQLVPLLAILGGEMECQTISEHCATNIEVCGLFTETRFSLNGTTVSAVLASPAAG